MFRIASSFDQFLGWTTMAFGANDRDTYRGAPCAYCKCCVNSPGNCDACQTKNAVDPSTTPSPTGGGFSTVGLVTPAPSSSAPTGGSDAPDAPTPAPAGGSNSTPDAPTPAPAGGSDAATRSGPLLAGALLLLAFAL